MEGLSRDSETATFFGIMFYQKINNILRLQPINMYLFIEIRHNILIQCHGNQIEVKFNFVLESDILRSSSKNWVSLKVICRRHGRPNDLQMLFGLRSCMVGYSESQKIKK